MAYTQLKDDYTNDVLNENVNSNVKYILTDNGDGTVSLQDATSYTTLGDSLDASVINATNAIVNAIGNQVTQNVADIATNANDIGTHTTAIGANSADIAVLQDGKIDLDTVAAPGTIDGDLYAAIVALGWENDVIE